MFIKLLFWYLLSLKSERFLLLKFLGKYIRVYYVSKKLHFNFETIPAQSSH
jgi:hypothetical protein